MKDIRADLVRLMRATLADNEENRTWTYRAVRPCPVPPSWTPGQRVWGDCSKGVQFLCRWAQTVDPMGENFGPYGNSQTLWLRLQHLTRPSDLLPGDVVTFGHNGRDHAAMVLEAGLDPIVWSFGHQGSPNLYPLSRDWREHQYLRVPIPTYIPTPDDRLRARTGWFAWVAWRLGEGDWQKKGKENPAVRPDVPARIPAAWWARYAAFLWNRKHGDEASGL